MHGNRETPRDIRRVPDRSGKACGQNPDMNVVGESDIGIVPMRAPKNVGRSDSGGEGGKADDQGEP